MPIHVFRHTDAGAPVLSGQVGAMIALLDALLLNGYNTKTVTLARSGSTVTATSTAHGFVKQQVVQISGADQAGYNGLHKVTSASANTFTFEVDSEPATPATGTISCKVAAIGWTKEYSGTNLAAYKQPVGTCGFYLRVDDTATTSARVRGFEAMTAISTGTQAFPTTAQIADPGSYWWKSDSASSASREWSAYSDGKGIHLFVSNYSAGFIGNGSISAWYFFGDFKSDLSSDAYNCLLQSDANRTSVGSTANSSLKLAAINTSVATDYTRIVPRGYMQSGTALQCVAGSNHFLSASSAVFGGNGARFPNPTGNDLITSDIFVCEQSNVVRGTIPGALEPMHLRPFNSFYEVPSGVIADGREFFCQYVNSGGFQSTIGCLLIDVTGPWQ